jgi:hypothetical protein
MLYCYAEFTLEGNMAMFVTNNQTHFPVAQMQDAYHLCDRELQLFQLLESAHARKNYLKSTMVMEARAPLPIVVLASAPLNLLAFVVALPLRGRVTLLACLNLLIATLRCCSTLCEMHDRVNDNRIETECAMCGVNKTLNNVLAK